MASSMTAFARSEQRSGIGEVICELRSVNSRFLDLNFRLPDELRVLEPELREQLGRRLQRGKLDVSLRHHPAPNQAAATLDAEQLRRLLALIEQVDAHLRPPAALNAFELLRWPGVLRQPEQPLAAVQELARQAFGDALEQLIQARAREGGVLRELLLSRCDGIQTLVDQAREALPQIRQGMQQRLRERLAELGVEADAGRLEQELALQVQRLDVAEELDRLDAHAGEIRRTLDSSGGLGRRLDFLIQELHREANTLGSKSAGLATTRIAVELKVLIEQMREQVQNLA